MTPGNQQTAIISKFREALNQAVSVYEVGLGAVCISTPFLDWQGVPTKIYVTKDGKVTDGGNTINLLKSLRNREQFEEWGFLSDFLTRYCIDYDGTSMMLKSDSTDECLITYAQGISRLPSYFEPKPIYSSEDRFTERAKAIASDLIDKRNEKLSYNERSDLITSIIRPKHIPLSNGYSVTSDFSPRKKNTIVTIISHSKDSPSQRRAHVQSKMLDPILWKRERKNGEVLAVLEDFSAYPQVSQRLLENETDYVIELKDEIGREKLADALLAI